MSTCRMSSAAVDWANQIRRNGSGEVNPGVSPSAGAPSCGTRGRDPVTRIGELGRVARHGLDFPIHGGCDVDPDVRLQRSPTGRPRLPMSRPSAPEVQRQCRGGCSGVQGRPSDYAMVPVVVMVFPEEHRKRIGTDDCLRP